MTSNADCLPGYIKNGDICEPCPEGESSVDHITCVPCPVGQYYNRTKINRCQPCPAGSTTTEPGTIDITNCGMFFNCKCCVLTLDYSGYRPLNGVEVAFQDIFGKCSSGYTFFLIEDVYLDTTDKDQIRFAQNVQLEPFPMYQKLQAAPPAQKELLPPWVHKHLLMPAMVC